MDISRETIGVDSNPDLWVDVNQFRGELAVCQTHDHAEAAVCPDCLPHLREAISLYRDDFLAGFTLRDSPDFDEWQRFQAEEIRRELTEALERLVRGQSTQEDFKAAIPYAQRWLALDPLHEPAHRQLMELYARAGQRAAALHQYAECERILQEELGIPPSLETTALAERIRLDTEGQQGQLIKSYELQELIGAGGFGEVYRAYQPQVRREVAIKVILPQFANQAEFIRRFEAEAHMVAQLEHPHIVPLYDYWREPDGAYLVMRWLRGGSLEDALKSGPWNPKATTQLLDQIAAALMLAHQRGIIHRDLKPANILLDEGGNGYLTDFGIAKAVATPRSATQTQVGVVLGSPAYMAPEAANDEPITPQTDIYSLGVMLFEILTGQHPFPDTTPPMMLVKHLSEPLPPLQLPDPDLSTALNEVIQRATAKNPADRYVDTISLATDFRRALGSDQVSVTVLPDESTPLLVPNPYKGLHAFQEGDAADFFGREVLVEQLLMRLVLNLPTKRQPSSSQPLQPPHLQNFLAVVGPSGSGKSSLVKAGLIPALRQNAIRGSKDWFIVEMTPGSHPLVELEVALLRIAINPPPTLLDQLQADEHGLLRAVKRILPDDESELLLVIDQFEEVFTLVEDKAMQRHFLDSLHVAVTEPDSRLRVVITLRADFYDRPLLYPGFGDLLRQRMETVLPLSNEELEQAIAGPAERVGATFETGLIRIIVSDVQEQPGTLPLMQYALTELFERRRGRRLTLDAYQASGSVFGALARRADELYTELDDAGRIATRRLFLRLVTLGEGVEDTRRRVLRSELTALTADHRPPTAEDSNRKESAVSGQPSSVIDQVIDQFGQYRLLAFDRDPVTRGPTVEVAHEALIREWDRLRQWLDEDREFLMWQQRLKAGLHQWEANEQDEGALLRGAPLAEAENWLNQRWIDLNETEREFIRASQTLRGHQAAEREAQRQRELEAAQKLAETESARAEEQAQSAGKLRRRALYLTGALVIAGILAVVAVIFGQQANRNEQNALVQQAIAVTEAEQRATAQANAEQEREIAQQQREEAQSQTNLATSRELSLAALNNLEADPELSMLLAMQALDTSYTKEAEEALRQGLQTSRILMTLEDNAGTVWAAIYSPDGSHIATGSDDSTIKVWEAASGQLLHTMPFSGIHFMGQSLAFDETGNEVAVVTYGDNFESVILHTWIVESGELLSQIKLPIPLIFGEAVALSPDWHWIAAGGENGTVEFWGVETAEKLFTLSGHDDKVALGVSFSPDGSRLSTASVNGQVQVWDVGASVAAREGQLIVSFATQNNARLLRTFFNVDCSQLAVGFLDGPIEVWDLADINQPKFILPVDLDNIAFHPDNTYLATGGDWITMWDLTTGEELFTISGHKGIIHLPNFSPDGSRLLAGTDDGKARVWNVKPHAEGEILTFAAAHSASDLELSPDERKVALGSDSGPATVWDAITGEQLMVLPGNPDTAVYRVAFNPDGSRLATVGEDGLVRIWDAETGELLLRFTGHTEGRSVGSVGTLDVEYSPDGSQLATAGADKLAKVWDAETGKELMTLAGHTAGLVSLGYSPDGRYLATSSDSIETSDSPSDADVKIWDMQTGAEVYTLGPNPQRAWGLAFSPDGHLVAAGGSGGFLSVWDMTTGKKRIDMTGQSDDIGSVAFTPDGQRLVSGGGESASIWDLATGTELVNLAPKNNWRVALTEDGRRLYAADYDTGTVRVYAIPLEDVVSLAQSRLTRSLTKEECRQYLHAEVCSQP